MHDEIPHKMIKCNSLGFYTAQKRWTKSAIDCYEIGCDCSKCYLSYFVHPCHMKAAVLELVRKFGRPKREIND